MCGSVDLDEGSFCNDGGGDEANKGCDEEAAKEVEKEVANRIILPCEQVKSFSALMGNLPSTKAGGNLGCRIRRAFVCSVFNAPSISSLLHF